jgi:ribosomal protein S18 acetylase RimI-like enzyme
MLGLSVEADNVPALRLLRRQGFAPWLVLQSYELLL